MVTVLKTEGGTQIISASLQKTIQSIKEIVGNRHSDSDVYNALKESNMDPNETAQKLLNQDPFHEVRRRRDKKKENAGYNGLVEPRKRADYPSQGAKFNGFERNARRGGYTRESIPDAGINQEFRVVRDNRVNPNFHSERKALPQVISSSNVERINSSFERSSSVSSNNQRHFGVRYARTLTEMTDLRPKLVRDMSSSTREERSEGRKSAATLAASQNSAPKRIESHPQSGSNASSDAVGVYASASDPVHVPSPDSRSPAAIGAIRREVGVVGRRTSETTSKQSFQRNVPSVKPVLEGSSSTEPFRSMDSVSRNDQSHATGVESVMVGSGTRLTNHFGGRFHQHVGHNRGVVLSKEWKPKTTQKSNVPNPGVIGSPVKSASESTNNSQNVDRVTVQLDEKLSQLNIHESENVTIAPHIRVLDNDRCRLMFGSFAMESDNSESLDSQFQVPERVEEPHEPSPSSKQKSTVNDQVRNSGSETLSSGGGSESQLTETGDSCGVSSRENYSDMDLAPNNPSFTSKSQQQSEPAELPNLSAYDAQSVYDIPYIRHSIEDTVHGPGMKSFQEALSSHAANNAPASSMAMMQQQAPVAQMFPQVHLSHFANVMPYRQFIPPLYVAPMVPGYSGNPGYPHLSGGGSYVLMPGGNSHISANALKYGVQQYKGLPGGNATGFSNFTNPAGYAINTPCGVGRPAGVDDSSWLKYKDSNLYVPNPQAETSEVWMQNHREVGGMQSAPYFNMQNQTAHPAYLQSHTAHASLNAQSSHMQFSGMYPPQQPAAIPTTHHPGGTTISIGVTPTAAGAQVGGYQQAPQMGPVNWMTNF